MPFYLVTHSSLIEADTAESAARIAVEKIRSDAKISVSVTSDHTTIDRVIVGHSAESQVTGSDQEL
ncbi:MAG: hypothetical protein KDK08_16060 [Rhizobiaceae bacterium]|nr:hypothetical protein [Rhizobiaceae bacterium]